ncbi:unnamed protein product [Spirodela intermedia]|uniref:RRM domain-containing protein n=1 Tax=Spirodela intermedia TaxID=51605 RepID=A0A7I8JAU0_SPIIN|nr:unnamed protein product [Spirodela intermedia]CAA6667326.1 unnamed protein product [Spirodela intermedia]
MVDPTPTYFGGSPSSSFMYGGASYGYISHPPPFPVVRLRGLPFDCTELDIHEFFQGLDIVDVLFVHKNGRFSGEAFCKNRQNMGRRYVEVFRSKRQEYYTAVAHEVSDSRGGSPAAAAAHTGVLRMRGLPFSAGKEDVLDFFKDFSLSEESIFIVLNPDGRPTGEAFVDFGSAEDSKLAMVKDRMMLGSRYIELFPSATKEMDYAISKGK